jgi:hypothetical protein
MVLLASFGLAGYASLQLFSQMWMRVAVWFVGAAVGHDLVLLPVYGVADAGAAWIWRRRGPSVPTAQWINYVRAPTMLSGILFLIWLPEITGLNHRPFLRTSGLNPSRFLGDWLLVTGIAFLVSALLFAISFRRAARRTTTP